MSPLDVRLHLCIARSITSLDFFFRGTFFHSCDLCLPSPAYLSSDFLTCLTQGGSLKVLL